MLFRRNFRFEEHKLPVHSNRQKKTYCVPVTEELRGIDSKLAVVNQESIHCTTKKIIYFYNATDVPLTASHNCENYIRTVLFISGYTIYEELIRGK